MKKIGIFSVGTGGHVIPSRNIIEQLIDCGISADQFVVVTDPRGSKYFKKLKIKIYEKKIYRSKIGIAGYFLNFPKIIKNLVEIKKLIEDEDIKIIFSTGSYVAPLASILCLFKNIEFISQEQNIYSGLGNKIASYLPGKIFTSFPETKNINKKKIEYVGPIINKNLKKNINRNRKILTIGIQGGSQGSIEINNYLYNFIDRNSTEQAKFIHITGKGKSNKSYNFNNYEQYDYISDMNTYYERIDLQISRSGGGAFEAAYLDIPQILIPYKLGTTANHQTLNAKYFENLGVAFIANSYEEFEKHLFHIFQDIENWKIKYFKESKIKSGNDKICNYLLEILNE